MFRKHGTISTVIYSLKKDIPCVKGNMHVPLTSRGSVVLDQGGAPSEVQKIGTSTSGKAWMSKFPVPK